MGDPIANTRSAAAPISTSAPVLALGRDAPREGGGPSVSQSTSPAVSVITAVLDNLEGLRATVDSVAAQAVPSCEHIVIDGGSTDGTRPYLEAEGQSLTWISEPDGGIAEALNKGVAMARGSYVLVLQAEDRFAAPDSLARALPALQEGHDIVSFDVRVTSAEGGRRYPSRGFHRHLNFKSTIPHQGAFCRRDLFTRIGAFETGWRIGMDYDFFLRAWRRGATLRLVPEILAEMPDTGVSSRLDWPGLRARIREEQAIHLHHCPGPAWRLWYALRHTVYPPYKRAKTWVTRHRRGR